MSDPRPQEEVMDYESWATRLLFDNHGQEPQLDN